MPALVVAAIVASCLSSCSRKPVLPALNAADSLNIVQSNFAHRAEVDVFFRTDPNSPFRRDTTISYHGLRWYPIDPLYCATSVLRRYDSPDTVIVMGTRGEKRHELRYGWFEFVVPDEQRNPVLIRLNVYKFTPYDGQRYFLFKDNLNVWFTDRTTGHETYGVGRYVDCGTEVPDKSHLYTIDLNQAYNPYCAYSSLYSCPIPPKEDTIGIALRVGEMKYHE